MALSVKFTKNGVTEPQLSMYYINITMQILEATQVVYEQDFPVEHKPNRTIQESFDRAQEMFQEAIDKYRRESDLFANTDIDDSLVAMESALDTGSIEV